MDKITEDNCPDCLMGREDGIQWCPVHYDETKDNARAIEQTGIGIADVVAKQKAAIRQKCIAANPEIVELKFGCELKNQYGKVGKVLFSHGGGKTCRVILLDFSPAIGDWFADHCEIIGRPIRLADVLLAIGNSPKGYVEYEGGGRSSTANLSINSAGICMNENGMHLFEWNLRADDLDQQRDATISFIHSLLK